MSIYWTLQQIPKLHDSSTPLQPPAHRTQSLNISNHKSSIGFTCTRALEVKKEAQLKRVNTSPARSACSLPGHEDKSILLRKLRWITASRLRDPRIALLMGEKRDLFFSSSNFQERVPARGRTGSNLLPTGIPSAIGLEETGFKRNGFLVEEGIQFGAGCRDWFWDGMTRWTLLAPSN